MRVRKVHAEGAASENTPESEHRRLPAHALPELATVSDVAAWLRTTEKSIHNMRQRAQLPRPVKIGRRLLWEREALRTWLTEQRDSSTTRRT